MKKTTKLLMAIIVASSLTLFAQDENYLSEPGYVNFENLSSLFNEDDLITEVLIEEKLLRMVSKFTDNEEEPELSSLLDGLKLIKVNTFEVNPTNAKQLLQNIKTIDKDLRRKKWDRIVKTKSKGEATNVYVKTVGDEDFVGLTVVTMDDDEATFVNIVGSIDLETINKLGDKFDIPGLEDIKKKKK